MIYYKSIKNCKWIFLVKKGLEILVELDKLIKKTIKKLLKKAIDSKLHSNPQIIRDLL